METALARDVAPPAVAAAGGPVAAGVVAGARRDARWIISPGADLAFFVFVSLLTIGPWLASDRFGISGHWILYSVAIFNGPHLFSTWTRVYLPRGERFRRPLAYWVVPGLLAAFAIGCLAAGGLGPVYLRTVIFYWASWHFVAQAWGILRIYQRKHGVVGTPIATIERVLLFVVCGFCVLRRIYTGPWELFGVLVIHPYPHAWVVNAVGGVTVLAALAYVVAMVRQPPAVVRPLLIAFTAFGFVMPFVVIKNGTSAFAAAALWHAVQYLGIVWHYNRSRYGGRPVGDEARVIAWASQPGRTVAYGAVLLACALGAYGVIVAAAPLVGWSVAQTSLAMWTSMTLGHYWLDGVIWKSRRYDLRPLVAAA
jgi:hypothetical protein